MAATSRSWRRQARLTSPACCSRYRPAVPPNDGCGLCGTSASSVPGAKVKLPRSSTCSGGGPPRAIARSVASSVDLPLPLRPISARRRPWGTAKFASSSSTRPPTASIRPTAAMPARVGWTGSCGNGAIRCLLLYEGRRAEASECGQEVDEGPCQDGSTQAPPLARWSSGSGALISSVKATIPGGPRLRWARSVGATAHVHHVCQRQQIVVQRDQGETQRLGRGGDEEVHRPAAGMEPALDAEAGQPAPGACYLGVYRHRVELGLHEAKPAEASCPLAGIASEQEPEVELRQRDDAD